MDQLFALEHVFFNLGFSGYIIATLLYVFYLVIQKEKAGKFASGITFAGLIFHTISIVLRTINAGRLPLNNQFEFALCFAWGIILCYLFLEKRFDFKYRGLGAFVLPIGTVIMGYAFSLPRDIIDPMPALQSNWLSIHVGVSVIAYGAFAVACGLSILYLLKNRHFAKHPDSNPHSIYHKYFPELRLLDDMNYKTVAVGFLFLTLCILSGAIWAEQAWARYWSWDPKETWSLITWIVYALFLHARFTRGWRGNKTAWFAIIGFICVLITYIGVNVFLPSIHSYV